MRDGGCSAQPPPHGTAPVSGHMTRRAASVGRCQPPTVSSQRAACHAEAEGPGRARRRRANSFAYRSTATHLTSRSIMNIPSHGWSVQVHPAWRNDAVRTPGRGLEGERSRTIVAGGQADCLAAAVDPREHVPDVLDRSNKDDAVPDSGHEARSFGEDDRPLGAARGDHLAAKRPLRPGRGHLVGIAGRHVEPRDAAERTRHGRRERGGECARRHLTVALDENRVGRVAPALIERRRIQRDPSGERFEPLWVERLAADNGKRQTWAEDEILDVAARRQGPNGGDRLAPAPDDARVARGRKGAVGSNVRRRAVDEQHRPGHVRPRQPCSVRRAALVSEQVPEIPGQYKTASRRQLHDVGVLREQTLHERQPAEHRNVSGHPVRDESSWNRRHHPATAAGRGYRCVERRRGAAKRVVEQPLQIRSSQERQPVRRTGRRGAAQLIRPLVEPSLGERGEELHQVRERDRRETARPGDQIGGGPRVVVDRRKAADSRLVEIPAARRRVESVRIDPVDGHDALSGRRAEQGRYTLLVRPPRPGRATRTVCRTCQSRSIRARRSARYRRSARTRRGGCAEAA